MGSFDLTASLARAREALKVANVTPRTARLWCRCAGIIDPQKHSGAGANRDVLVVRAQHDNARGIDSARVGDFQVFYAVNPARIGRENPQGLRAVVPIDGTAALCSFFGGNGNEDAVRNGFADDLRRILVAGHRSFFAVDDIAANLHGGEPAEDVAFSRSCNWRLRFENIDESGNRPQMRDDWNRLAVDKQTIELQSNTARRGRVCGGYRDNPAAHFAAASNFLSAWQRDVLHDRRADDLAGLVL